MTIFYHKQAMKSIGNVSTASALCLVIVVKEGVPYTVFFPCDDSIYVHIFHALEDVLFDFGICLLQRCYQLFYLNTLRACLLVVAGGAGIGELAGTLDKMKPVIVTPSLDIVLPYKI